MAVTPTATGWSSSDLIYVTYNAQTQFKIGNVVTVYGAVSGTYNYISSSQGMQTLLKVIARDIELTPLTSSGIVPLPFTSSLNNNSNNITNSQVNSNNSTNQTTNNTNTTTGIPV